MKTLILVFFTFTLQSQSITYNDLQKATEKPNGPITSYVTSGNDTLTVGSKIKIGHPSNGLFFNYVYQGDMYPKKAGTTSSGDQVEIKTMVIDGNKRTGFKIAIATKGAYHIDLENAIETGEVKLP